MTVNLMKTDKQVVIQKRIDEVMREEFEKVIIESSKDPLLRLIRDSKISSMTLQEVRVYLKGNKK
jgi:hypothetical protein